MSTKKDTPIILLLGGNKLNYGILTKFRHQGFLVFVIDWNKEPQMSGDKHYQIDVKEPYEIISALKKDNCWDKVYFAYSSIDLAVSSVAIINREIGLKTITDKGLKFSCSKSMMTKRWNELGLLNRFSKSYYVFNEEISEKNQIMKLIIKPDNSASSRGITIIEKNTDINKLKNAFIKAEKEASNNLVVVEEYVEGTEYTVEMIGDSFGNVSVYGISKKSHTKNTINNRIAVKLHYNSITEKQQKLIADFGIQCYKALNFSSSLGHLEVIMKSDGTISPIEIGARSSGYIASDLVDVVSDSNFLGDLIEVQKGGRIANGLHKQCDKSAMYFFYDFPKGMVVKKETNLLEFCDESINSRYFDRYAIKNGRCFGLINNDNARFGYEILEGPKNIMTEDYISEVEEKMLKYMMGE